MATSTFNPLVTPIDFVLLAGQRSPGLATVAKASRPERWDERAGYGLSGAVSVYLGSKLAHFDLTLRLYTDADWVGWGAWKVLVDRPPRGQRAKALDIWHPWLVDLGIKSVGVEGVAQPEEIDNGGYSITVGLIEYRVPKLALAKPIAPDAAPTQTESDKRVSALVGELESLNQASSLAPAPHG